MPFTRPTLADLVTRTLSDTTSRLSVDALLRRADAEVLARVLAGTAHGLYGYIDWLSRQILPDMAESEWLDRHASLWLQNGRKPAATASGSINFAGVDGSLIPVGTLLTTANGVQVKTAADVTISAGIGTATAVAVVAGASGNLPAGLSLALVSPVYGVQSTATVSSSGFTGGADIESDDSLRERIISRIQQPPHGGAEHDYIAWALEAPGVTRAWCYPREMGLGTVTVRFMRDGDVNPIPDAAAVAAVQAYIDVLRPVTASVYVVAPIAVPLNFTISATPNTQAVRDAIKAELQDLLLREAEPGATILLSHIREAISIAAGEINYVMSAPAADVTHTTGQMAVMGTITWA